MAGIEYSVYSNAELIGYRVIPANLTSPSSIDNVLTHLASLSSAGMVRIFVHSGWHGSHRQPFVSDHTLNGMVSVKKKVAQEADQPGLFGSASSIHELVLERGLAGTLQAAENAVLDDRKTSLTKALASDRGRLIADTAVSAATRDVEGGSVPGYSYSAWCLAGLPHRDLEPGLAWGIDTGFARLLVKPGVVEMPDGTMRNLRVPSGTFARLLLLDIQTEVIKHGRREIKMGPSIAALIERLGIRRGGPVSMKLSDQLERLCNAWVTFNFGPREREELAINALLVEGVRYSAHQDPRSKHRAIDTIILSEAFFSELRRHPVLVDRAAIRDLMTSPQAIDIYLWLAFRLHSLREQTGITWERLWKQFGARVGKKKNFRSQFEAPLHLALSAYPRARVDVMSDGLVLHPSPPPIDALAVPTPGRPAGKDRH